MTATTMPIAEAARTDVVLTVRGRFDGSTVALVRAALHEAIEASTSDIRLDVLDVEWIDVPALAVLADAHRRLHREGRRLVVVACSDQVRRALAVTRLNRVIVVRPRRRTAAA